MLNPLHLLLTILLATECSSATRTEKEECSDLQLVYTVDKDGLFLYDLKTGKDKKIYSTHEKFLDDEMSFLNDSIFIVALKVKSVKKKRNDLFIQNTCNVQMATVHLLQTILHT